jgi:hypothetical protein
LVLPFPGLQLAFKIDLRAFAKKPLGKIAEQYLSKGSTVYIEGQLETRKWQDQSGQDRLTTEVVLPRFGGAITLIGGKGDNGGDAPFAPTRDDIKQEVRDMKRHLDDDLIPF